MYLSFPLNASLKKIRCWFLLVYLERLSVISQNKQSDNLILLHWFLKYSIHLQDIAKLYSLIQCRMFYIIFLHKVDILLLSLGQDGCACA
ncbi:hypothetical protein GDO86_006528 [Hymenochirus boettgeri]|uniref:Uncharacterized protein n=1 Tax=Hymenochirus boettgeri TaxID=247094 RepID=A0A8T2J6G6_9PIPI|nr:hypothetical protein GDO86_006528 [Hymenochirus boettgeri]